MHPNGGCITEVFVVELCNTKPAYTIYGKHEWELTLLLWIVHVPAIPHSILKTKWITILMLILCSYSPLSREESKYLAQCTPSFSSQKACWKLFRILNSFARHIITYHVLQKRKKFCYISPEKQVNILHLPPPTKRKRPPVSSSIAHLPKLQVIVLGRMYNAYFP